MQKLILLIILAGMVCVPGRAIRFKQLSLDEGLSQNSVFCMIQDHKGFLWFGTQDGLNKYDGYTFTIYKPQPGDPESLSHNWITALFEDSSGKIWIGTQGGGLNRFDPLTGKFTRFPVSGGVLREDSITSRTITSICQSKNGDIWIAAQGGGVSVYNNSTFKHFVADPGDPDSLVSNNVTDLLIDNRGTLWVGTANDGLKQFQPESGTFIHYRYDKAKSGSLSANRVVDIYEDSAGLIWIGTGGGGLNLMNRAKGTFIHYRNRPDDPDSLSSDQISNIHEDRSGVLWVSTTDRGINHFNKRRETFTRYLRDDTDPYSLNNNSVSCIYEDRSRVLWVGTNGGGLNRFDRENKFQLLRADPNNPNGLSDSFIYTICEDHNGVMWIGANDGALTCWNRDTGSFKHYRNQPDNPKSLGNGVVRWVYEDRSHRLWIGLQGGGLNLFHPEDESFSHYSNNPEDPMSISSNAVRQTLEDSAGRFWIATAGGGLNRMYRDSGKFISFQFSSTDPGSISDNSIFSLYEAPTQPGILWLGNFGNGLDRFDANTGRAINYRNDPSDPHSLSHDTVLSIYEDKKGNLWICTYGGGINKFTGDRDGKGNARFVYYTEQNGLANNSTYGMLEDPTGKLWISTNYGISCFDPATERFINYNAKDGLQGNEFNSNAFFKTRSGEMFFAGLNGLNWFDPSNMDSNRHIPPVVLTGFKLFNKNLPIGGDSPLQEDISYASELCFNHKQNAFSFEFAALDYTVPENNRYAYKMENMDAEWNTTSSAFRVAAYTNMPPGHYVFRVRGSNNDGKWNTEGTSIKITITPPFWMTWWFRFLVLAVLIGVIALLYRRRLKNERLKFELKTAHDAQMSIMPQTDPEIGGFEISGVCLPAYEVGGDFFDYIWLDKEKKRLGIAVGDVSGKAMKSAMTAVMTSGMLYSRVGESRSVKEIMHQVNLPLYFKTAKNMFTALCLAALDLESRDLTFSNAGLHAPLLKSPATPYVTALESSGDRLPLGIKMNASYMESRYSLSPGDVVIFFTDGVTEAMNGAGDFYGDRRLRGFIENLDTGILSAAGIKNAVLADLKRFSAGAPRHDDITVVVVKVS